MKLKSKKVIISILLCTVFITFFAQTSSAAVSDFIEDITDGYNNQPYLVEKQNNRQFIIRPEAEQFGTNYTNIRLNFRSVSSLPASSTDIQLVDDQGAAVTGGTDDGNIDWIDNGGEMQVQIDISWLQGLEDATYTIRLGGLDFVDIELRPVRPAPVIEAELTNYSEYGTLDSNQIYYVQKETNTEDYGGFLISNSFNIDLIRYRIEKDKATYDYTGDISLFSNTAITTLNDIDDGWLNESTNNVPSSTTWNSYWTIEDNIPAGVETTLQEIEDRGNLELRIFRVVARNYGSAGATARNYYIVVDERQPEIKPLDKNGNPKSTKKFDVYNTRRPQLKVNINDDVANVDDVSGINAEIIPMPSGHDENDLPTVADFTNANQLDVIGITERDNNGNQTATMIPFSELGEGEYAVRVEATDQAGNSSANDTDGDGDVDAPYIFYLKVNQTEPEINNVRINDQVMNTIKNSFVEDEQAVNADGLNLDFEAYGTEELIYGIRYIGDSSTTNSDWFLIKNSDINYVSQFIAKDILSYAEANNMFEENGAPKNGVYELFIIAGEQSMISDGDDLDNELNGSNYGTFAAPGPIFQSDLEDGGAYIGDLIQDIKDGTAAETRTYIHFQIEVDGNPPQFKAGSLKYFKNYPSGKNNLPENGSREKIYQGQPVFEGILINSSDIRRDDIDIFFENQEDGRILSGDVITPPDVSGDEHTIRFQPVIGLTPGIYTLRIRASDEFGNTTNVGQIEFTDSFEILTTVEGKIDFSITEGERLNINESSALEIELTDATLDPANSLRIEVNGAPIVVSGSIVDEIVVDNNGVEQILTKDDEYYKKEKINPDKFYYEETKDRSANQNDYKEGYQADGFDVFFFNNKRRVVIFSRQPLPSGRNRVTVEVVDENGVLNSESIEFMVDSYRHGFGFGRLLPNTQN